MKIIDDLLSKNDLKEIQDVMMGPDFPWYYNVGIDHIDQKDKFQFVHLFYNYDRPMSPFYDDWYMKLIKPIIGERSQIKRIKANLLTKTTDIIANEFHTDDHTKKPFTTAIFYLNSNNGHTEFENGRCVESRENRLIRFPVGDKHTGTSCTDENIRVVINFFYMEL